MLFRHRGRPAGPALPPAVLELPRLLKRMDRRIARAHLTRRPGETMRLVYQFLGWLVPSVFIAAICIVGPLGYAVVRRGNNRAARQEALIVVLERLRQELETVTLQEALLRIRASAPEVLVPTFAQLERPLTCAIEDVFGA